MDSQPSAELRVAYDAIKQRVREELLRAPCLALGEQAEGYARAIDGYFDAHVVQLINSDRAASARSADEIVAVLRRRLDRRQKFADFIHAKRVSIIKRLPKEWPREQRVDSVSHACETIFVRIKSGSEANERLFVLLDDSAAPGNEGKIVAIVAHCARQRHIDQWRPRRREEAGGNDILGGSPERTESHLEVEQQDENVAVREEVEAALRTLSSLELQCLNDHVLDGKSGATIATRRGVSRQAIRQNIARAKSKLRKVLSESPRARSLLEHLLPDHQSRQRRPKPE